MCFVKYIDTNTISGGIFFMRHLKKKRSHIFIYIKRFDNFFSRPIMATFCFLLLSDSYIKCLTPPSHSHKEVFGPFLFKDRNPKKYFQNFFKTPRSPIKWIAMYMFEERAKFRNSWWEFLQKRAGKHFDENSALVTM